ncbi:MAG: hypothetical protein WCT23_01240 [Candidatus Neomarinimicrobiota bacterium]|jgi:hypothetical protein
MKKILLVLFSLTVLFAGEGLPVLTLPTFAQDGYMPSSPVYKEKGITFSYASWYKATNYTSIVTELGDVTFGFKGLMSSDLEIRGEVPTDEPIGLTQYYNSTVFLNKNWNLNDKWTLNTGASLINEKLFIAGSWGGTVDMKIIRNFNVNSRVMLGVENIGWMSTLSNVATNIPARYYFGSDFILFDFLILSMQAGVNNDIDPYLRAGIRYFHPVFELTYSHDTMLKVHHFGADLKWDKFRIGYGQYLHSQGIGSPMMFSFGMVF